MNKQNKHDWKFSSIGGVTRVTVTTGADIAHLDELDQKLWTVLSCPVDGLEFDNATLQLLDVDGDKKVRVCEIIKASKWLTGALNNADLLLEGKDTVAFADINADNEDGAKILASAQRILQRQGAEKQEISLDDVKAAREALNAHVAEKDAATAAEAIDARPYGDKTDDAVAAVAPLREKMADYFMRCKLIAFNEGCSEAVDVSVEKIQAISENNLAACGTQIAAYPLSHPVKECVLRLDGGINPAWQADFDAAKALTIDVDYPDAKQIDEAQWNAIVAKLDAYVATKDSEKTAKVELFDKEMTEEDEDITLLHRFLHFYRDFYKLLKNYVVFADFYTRDPNKLAVFQCGQLYIDQRCCDLCVKVADMPKTLASAGKSGLYLLVCHCVSKVKGKEMDIVAALTDGDVDELHEGKNAVFYDRDGQDWDAVVTKIIDNPISIRQAFWAPYKKLWNWITEKINKNAAEKEASSMENLTAKTDTAMTSAQTNIAAGAEGTAPAAAPAEKKQAFDIAKFAGIFAAIGMAVGFILSALTDLGKGIVEHWYTLPLLIIGIIVVVSGPSMFIAWTKLRKRNLGPVLNANGWAINSQVRINTVFGSTLTSLAKYPRVTVPDPYADKKTPCWKKWLVAIVLLAAIFAALYFTNTLKYVGLPFHKEAEPEQVEAAANTDDAANANDAVTVGEEGEAPVENPAENAGEGQKTE
ncbi:MAG: hypothetical protein K5864_03470 [Bacteroidales bacterium]|nr:hypothetical protein [Bacteroidales bacterium]